MSDDPRSVPLPDEIPLPLTEITELFGAVEQALEALAAARGTTDPVYARLDEALATMSRTMLRHLGMMWEDDEYPEPDG